MNIVKSGVIIGGRMSEDHTWVCGTEYTAEEWAQKLRDERAARMEEKLDAIMRHFKIEGESA